MCGHEQLVAVRRFESRAGRRWHGHGMHAQMPRRWDPIVDEYTRRGEACADENRVWPNLAKEPPVLRRRCLSSSGTTLRAVSAVPTKAKKPRICSAMGQEASEPISQTAGMAAWRSLSFSVCGSHTHTLSQNFRHRIYPCLICPDDVDKGPNSPALDTKRPASSATARGAWCVARGVWRGCAFFLGGISGKATLACC